MDNDAISRAKVLNEFADWFGYGYQQNTFYKRLVSMPSVQQQDQDTKIQICLQRRDESESRSRIISIPLSDFKILDE